MSPQYHFIQRGLPSAAHVSPAHMASLVLQGYPGEMDVTVVTEIRDPRERLDQRDLQDCKEQREKLVSGALADQKESVGRLGQVEALRRQARRIIKTGKSVHGKT